MDSKSKAGALLQTSLTFESNPYSSAPRNPLTPITLASDRTADQLQMFLLLNSAAGLSGVCIKPRFPDTHYHRPAPRRLPHLLITEKQLPNSSMNNCLMTRFKDKHLFLKNTNYVTWGGSVAVLVLPVRGVRQHGADHLAGVFGSAPRGHFLPVARVCPEALTALCEQELC